MEAFEKRMRRGGQTALAEVAQFFMKRDPVHQTLQELARRLDDAQVAYAIVGGMALVAHGYLRTTEDVDVLVSRDGLDAVHAALSGRGYVPPHGGSRNLRDTRTGVRVEFLVSGEFPGDGKPKPVAFPTPEAASVEIDGIRYVSLPTLVELKLASGMTSPARLRDLADVQELIARLGLDEAFGARLNPFVREQYQELRRSLQAGPGPDSG